jgi:hypothetical protein
MNQPTNNLGDNQDPAQRDSNDQVSSPHFQCPTCRARQPLQSQCRRCRSDLSLVVAAHRRIAFIREQLEQATEDSPQHKRFKKEFQMLVGIASINNTQSPPGAQPKGVGVSHCNRVC